MDLISVYELDLRFEESCLSGCRGRCFAVGEYWLRASEEIVSTSNVNLTHTVCRESWCTAPCPRSVPEEVVVADDGQTLNLDFVSSSCWLIRLQVVNLIFWDKTNPRPSLTTPHSPLHALYNYFFPTHELSRWQMLQENLWLWPRLRVGPVIDWLDFASSIWFLGQD